LRRVKKEKKSTNQSQLDMLSSSLSIRNNRLLSLSLLRRIQQQQQSQQWICRGLSSSSNNFYKSQQQKWIGKNIIAGAAAFLVAATTFLETNNDNNIILSSCEGKKETVDDNNDNNEIDSNKYENLPEEDEETPCSICKVHRQGPCRRVWRPFEYCTKDKDNISVAEKCDTYMFPWVTCMQEHPNLYRMLYNQLTQHEYVDEYETSLYWNNNNPPHQEWKINIDNDIDFTQLWSSTDNSDSNTTTTTTAIDQYHPDAMAKNYKTDADWAYFFLQLKTTDIDYYEKKKQNNKILMEENIIYDANTYEGDPKLVECGVRIPLFLTENDHNNATLEMCYVRDQNGRMLGMDQFSSLLHPRENNDKETSETQQQPPLSPQHEEVLKFYIEPGKTTSLRFYKVYQSTIPKKDNDTADDNEDKKEDKDNNEELAVYHTFVSKPIHIIQAAYHYEKQKQQQESSST